MIRLRVKELAEARGLNISQLQRQSGLDLGMVRRYWYNEGTRGPLSEVNLIALGKLAEVLGVHPGELIDPDGEEAEEIDSPMYAAA
jgi:transcriptional regulator with XRE-family HTH domain